MLYYLLLAIADVLFGTQFFLTGKYEEKNGSSLKSASLFTFATSLVGTLFLFLMNKCTLTYTPFTILMALATAVDCFLMDFCSTKALSHANLSLFSVFSMSGGMLLPFFAGILFYGEKLTLAKILCAILVIVAILLTIKKEEGKSGWLYLICAFIFNGLIGVFTMIFNNTEIAKGSAEDFSILKTAFCIAIALAVFLIVANRKNQTSDIPTTKSLLTFLPILYMAIYGIICNFGNYLLVISLEYIDGSLQYTIVTGGTMIVTTILGFFMKKKPTKRNILSLAIAILGILCLFIPI